MGVIILSEVVKVIQRPVAVLDVLIAAALLYLIAYLDDTLRDGGLSLNL